MLVMINLMVVLVSGDDQPDGHAGDDKIDGDAGDDQLDGDDGDDIDLELWMMLVRVVAMKR